MSAHPLPSGVTVSPEENAKSLLRVHGRYEALALAEQQAKSWAHIGNADRTSYWDRVIAALSSGLTVRGEQTEEQQQDLGSTKKNQPQEPEPSRDASVRAGSCAICEFVPEPLTAEGPEGVCGEPMPCAIHGAASPVGPMGRALKADTARIFAIMDENTKLRRQRDALREAASNVLACYIRFEMVGDVSYTPNVAMDDDAALEALRAALSGASHAE